MLDLRRLRLLRELESRGTLAAVAKALDYTPSAVSQGLAALEREAGVALMRRSGRRVVLTDAGRVLARHAAALLDGVAAAEAELARTAGHVAGPVTVVAFQSAMLRIVGPALPVLAREHPGVEVTCLDLELEPAIPALRLGTVDVAVGDEWVGTPRRPEPGCTRTPLLEEEVRLVLRADHPLAGHERVPLSALAGAVWATAHPGTGHHAAHLRHCRAVGGFEPDLRHASNDLVVLLELVRCAGAVSLMPDLAGADGWPGVVVRRIAEGNLERRLYTLTRTAGEARPALQAVLAEMRTQAAAAGGT